jgi:ribonuclease III
MDPVDSLQTRLGHTFSRPELLREALAHPSFCNEHPEIGPSNQRLEFLGDAVLQLIVTDALFQLYPQEPEGALSRRRSILTKGRCLAQIALELGIDSALRLGGSENTSAGRTRPSNLEDAFEALIGALYLDLGLEGTRALLLRIYGSLEMRIAAGSPVDNPKGRLQELIQATHGTGALHYETEHSAGPDHGREYSSRVYFAGRILGEGRGPSKKSAEEAAARIALSNHCFGA